MVERVTIDIKGNLRVAFLVVETVGKEAAAAVVKIQGVEVVDRLPPARIHHGRILPGIATLVHNSSGDGIGRGPYHPPRTLLFLQIGPNPILLQQGSSLVFLDPSLTRHIQQLAHLLQRISRLQCIILDLIRPTPIGTWTPVPHPT